MAVPATRSDFKEYCLRRLGKPVIEINIDDDQAEDRIDEALKFYRDYHFDGLERDFFKHAVTADDKTNKYITIASSELIEGVINLFDLGDATSTNNLFNVRYQISLNDMYDLSRYDLVPFFMNFMNIRFIEEILVGKQPLRFNRHKNRLHIDMDWAKVEVGQFIIAEVYRYLDPDTYTDMWSERWLQNYTTALFKVQWGQNLSKFTGMQLPGGVQFDGTTILQQGLDEKNKIEDEVIIGHSLPVGDMIG
jgi:hypothetical protein